MKVDQGLEQIVIHLFKLNPLWHQIINKCTIV